ncbi:MAG: hypothetical protein KAW41_02195 [Candidatus Diapherotrites archaeon]|nr:hypothetical protein [Candidatus Diapherotrites archaeon]
MRINLPPGAFLGNLDPFLREFDPRDPSTLTLSSHPKWVYVHPMVLSMVAALSLPIADKSKINVETMQAKSRPYFERMGLFKFLGSTGQQPVTEHDPSGRFIPLTRIRDSESLNRFITEMIPLLHAEPERVNPLKYVISELVRNVFEHSYSPYGAIVCAQFYPKSNSIKVGVADTGLGIKRTINESHPASTDTEAIGLALTPGITGATKRFGGNAVNAGAGLFFIKSIAKVNGDFFVIYSGSGMYKLLKSKEKERRKLYLGPFKDRHSKHDDFPYWQGTLVGVDISLDKHQPFTALLDLIGDTYQKHHKKRKKNGFKKAKFI